MPDPAAKKIRLLILDVDGVLTDGRIIIDSQGLEIKAFDVRDGAGIRLWQKFAGEGGGITAFITGRSSLAVTHRAADLGVHHVIQASRDKGAALTELLQRTGLTADVTAAVGDDLADLPMLRLAGYPIAVADAVPEVIAAAKFVTQKPGGHGAVREVIEHLLKARGAWEKALADFTGISAGG